MHGSERKERDRERERKIRDGMSSKAFMLFVIEIKMISI